ncbi:peptide deformylase [Oceaniglobus ichthyenteri]|uniref:peptide deformylase n=1 Tax=Oceaniglobus ichthyenteri TaxID=2136177 RepID=UPI000D35EB0D|nr:peptide deformylase [Oceaniglobus ichthyenteri]
MIRPIVLWPDPVLRAVCAPVTVFDDALTALTDDMLETMYDASGRGLAAPQIGVTRRVFVMDVTWKDGAPDPWICINPAIIAASADQRAETEGCLSIPDLPVQVTRPDTLTLSWQDLTGAAHRAMLSGFAATCAQHELDHLNGVTLFDHMSPDQRATFEAEVLP